MRLLEKFRRLFRKPHEHDWRYVCDFTIDDLRLRYEECECGEERFS